MDGLLNIFQSISNVNAIHLKKYLDAFDEHQCFQQHVSSAGDMIPQHLTNLLSKPATRHEGLLLLIVFVKQCSLDVIEQKGVLWSTFCIKTCHHKLSAPSIPLAYEALASLVAKSKDTSDFSKAVMNNILGKIFETLSSTPPAAFLSALKCIKTCLKVYPGPSGVGRSTVEKFLLSFVDSTDEALVYWSGKCLHLLQQVKGGGSQGQNHKSAWQTYQLKIIGSLHGILDSVFSNYNEIYDEAAEYDLLSIPALELSSEPVQRSLQLFLRFGNLITYLITALKDPFPVSKCIMPKKILNLITRGLAVNCTLLEKNPISDNLAVGALLPELHIKLFNLLDTLILMLKSNLAMYYKLIFGFISETLKWTSSGKASGFKKPYARLRIAAYNTVSLWCNTMKYGSAGESITDFVIKEIFHDITPFQSEVTLKVLSGSKKYMSKKARRQLHKAQNEGTNLAQRHTNIPNAAQITKNILSDEDNAGTCIAALECLKNILIASAISMKPTLIKEIQEKVLLLTYGFTEGGLNKSSLYANSQCRRELYNTLHALIIASNYLCPPPIQLIMPVLINGQNNDSNPTVRETCFSHLNNIEKIIHPQKELFLFISDFATIKNALKKDRNGELISEASDDEETELSKDETEAVVRIDKDKEQLENVVCAGQMDVDVDENDVGTGTELEDQQNDIVFNKEEGEGSILTEKDRLIFIEEEEKGITNENGLSTLPDIVAEVRVDDGEKSDDTTSCVGDSGVILKRCSPDLSVAEVTEDRNEPSHKKLRMSQEIDSEVAEGDTQSATEIIEENKSSEQNEADKVVNEAQDADKEINEDDLLSQLVSTFVNEINEG